MPTSRKGTKKKKRNSFYFSNNDGSGESDSDEEYKLAQQGDEFSPAYSTRDQSYFPRGEIKLGKQGIDRFTTQYEQEDCLRRIEFQRRLGSYDVSASEGAKRAKGAKRVEGINC